MYICRRLTCFLTSDTNPSIMNSVFGYDIHRSLIFFIRILQRLENSQMMLRWTVSSTWQYFEMVISIVHKLAEFILLQVLYSNTRCVYTINLLCMITLRRVGTLKNKSSAVIWVPRTPAHGFGSAVSPGLLGTSLPSLYDALQMDKMIVSLAFLDIPICTWLICSHGCDS